MATVPPLFQLPIPSSGGSFVCTQPIPKVYLLIFSSPPDNRMTEDFCKGYMLALDIIDHKLPKGVLVTTSAIPKFYSNGLDFESAIKTKGFFEETLYPLWRRILTYPMPTIAMLNGHTFAGGLMTAMMHDYRYQNAHKGFSCLNELDFGAPLLPPMASIFRQKARPDTFRNMILESKRFNALEALKEGIIDGIGGWDEVSKFIQEMKLIGRADTGVYGTLKEQMWRETVGYLERGADANLQEDSLKARASALRSEAQVKGVDEWEKWEIQNRNARSKL